MTYNRKTLKELKEIRLDLFKRLDSIIDDTLSKLYKLNSEQIDSRSEYASKLRKRIRTVEEEIKSRQKGNNMIYITKTLIL